MNISDTGSWQNDTAIGHMFDKGLARAISVYLRKVGGTSVFDLGCGPGEYVKFLKDEAFEALGVDGNPYTPQLSDGVAGVQDLTEAFFIDVFDWTMSIEVAEHIPADKTQQYLDNLDKHTRYGTIVSWAPPGQGGDGHINEQPADYVVEQFKARGFVVDHEHTNWLRECAEARWLKTNVTAFIRINPERPTFVPITPADLRISIMTCPREPEYLHCTLANLFMSGPEIHNVGSIDVFMDSPDLGFLDHYKHLKAVTIHTHTPEELQALQQTANPINNGKLWPHRRFCHNYFRCMDVDMTGYRGLIVIEDDVLISNNFVNKALDAINELSERRGPFVMSLCSLKTFWSEGTYVRGYAAPSFHGTQATFFCPEIIPHLKRDMWERGVVNVEQPGDLVIKDALCAWQNVYSPVVDIADHVGFVSSGLGGRSRSNTFYQPWPGE